MFSESKNIAPAPSLPYTIAEGLKPVLGLVVLFRILATRNGMYSQSKVGLVAKIFFMRILTVPTVPLDLFQQDAMLKW